MDKRRFMMEAVTIILAAIVCALVANALASRERAMALVGDYPTARNLPPRSIETFSTVPSQSTRFDASYGHRHECGFRCGCRERSTAGWKRADDHDGAQRILAPAAAGQHRRPDRQAFGAGEQRAGQTQPCTAESSSGRRSTGRLVAEAFPASQSVVPLCSA